MQIVNEEDLYLIQQYYKTNYQFVNYLYELNQRSYDRFYKLKNQKIKQLAKKHFKFKKISFVKVCMALIKIKDSISKDVLDTQYDLDCYNRLVRLSYLKV